jgi:NAD-dependent DNA ligase
MVKVDAHWQGSWVCARAARASGAFTRREEVTAIMDIMVRSAAPGSHAGALLRPPDVVGASHRRYGSIRRVAVIWGGQGLLDKRPRRRRSKHAGDAWTGRMCGDLCGATAHLAHFAWVMDIVGLGGKTVKQLIERGLVKDLADIYRLTPIDLAGLDGFAEKSIAKLIEAIEASKRPRLDRFLSALGIEHVGETVARLLADHFATLEPMLEATEEDLQKIRGIGPEVADSVRRFFQSPRNRRVLERLEQAGVRPERAPKRKGPQPLEGQVMVFTGGLERFSRPEAQRKAESLGATIASGISKKVTLVVAGPGAGTKLDEARKLKIEVIDEATFLERIGEG